MELIKIENSDRTVHLKIFVDFIGAWKFIYIVSLVPKVEFQYSSDLPPMDHEHPIGKGSKILGTSNTWDFQLINQSNQDLDFTVKIDWFQGDGSNPIQTWSKTSDILGKFKKDDDPKRFPDNCTFIPNL